MLRALRVLGIASNRLRSLDGVQPLLALRELYADHNGIDGLDPLAGLTRLHTLDLGLLDHPRHRPPPPRRPQLGLLADPRRFLGRRVHESARRAAALPVGDDGGEGAMEFCGRPP